MPGCHGGIEARMDRERDQPLGTFSRNPDRYLDRLTVPDRAERQRSGSPIQATGR
jgi:hypothetical protein